MHPGGGGGGRARKVCGSSWKVISGEHPPEEEEGEGHCAREGRAPNAGLVAGEGAVSAAEEAGEECGREGHRVSQRVVLERDLELWRARRGGGVEEGGPDRDVPERFVESAWKVIEG